VKLQSAILLMILVVGFVLSMGRPTGGQAAGQSEPEPKIVYLGHSFPTTGFGIPAQHWYLFCDRSRGNLLYVAWSGGQWAIAPVPGGCEKN
jgi:hypothetical protein